MDEVSRKEQVLRINAYDLRDEQIKLLTKVASSIGSFPYHPTQINGIDLGLPVPAEVMTRIRARFVDTLYDEIHRLLKEQEEI